MRLRLLFSAYRAISDRNNTHQAYDGNFDTMTNGTWVCFTCRLSQRQPTWRFVAKANPELIGGIGNGKVRCPKCHEPCCFLGPSTEIPPKSNQKGWLRLQSDVEKKRRTAHQRLQRERLQSRHNLERSMQELQDRPHSRERDRLIREMKKRIGED